MTLGDGIFWSTVLVLLAAAIYQMSIRKKWKTVGKVFGVVILAGAAIGGGAWAWDAYNNAEEEFVPSVVTALGGIRLGMSPVEVKLAKGMPETENEPTPNEQGKFVMDWAIGGMFPVVFFGDSPNNMKVALICQSESAFLPGDLLGLRRNDTESAVIERLGPPTHESISADALSKTISFEQWKVAYTITQGRISGWCVTESGSVTYSDEYQEAPSG
jgi:hypothetical protein